MISLSGCLTVALTNWHLCSLDAPTVAALWTWFLARATNTPLSPTLVPAMLLAVWILYALDRLLDARTCSPREARHDFHHRHRCAFQAAIGLAILTLVPLVLYLPRKMLYDYLALGFLLAIWYGIIHIVAPRRSTPLPKEIVTGIFFGLALSVPIAAGHGTEHGLALCAVLCTSAVATLNCLFIHRWEHPKPSARSVHPITLAGHHALYRLTALAVAVPAVLMHSLPASLMPILFATAVAATLLLLLDSVRHRCCRTTLRAAADLALLSPLLALGLLR
jgi:hypothetical protein